MNNGGADAERRLKAWELAAGNPMKIAGPLLAVARRYHWGGNWFAIHWKDAQNASLTIGDEIGCLGTDAKAVLTALAEARTVEIVINSHGGDSLAATELFHGLKGRVKNVYVIGACQSAAVTIAMCAERILADPAAKIMVHPPRLCRYGESNALRQSADYLDRLTGEIVEIIRERTKQPGAVVNGWFGQRDTHFSAQDALAVGLIDEILPPRPVDNAPAKESAPEFAPETESERDFFLLLNAYGRVDVSDKARFLRSLRHWAENNGA